jgi:hypothetical protein
VGVSTAGLAFGRCYAVGKQCIFDMLLKIDRPKFRRTLRRRIAERRLAFMIKFLVFAREIWLRGGDALTPNSHPLSCSWLAHHEPNLGLYSLLRMRAVDRYGSSNRRSNRLYCSRCCPSPKPQMGMMHDIDRFWQKNKMLLCQSCSKSSERSSRLNTGILHFGIWNFHCMGLGWIAPSQPVLGSKFIHPIRERE